MTLSPKVAGWAASGVAALAATVVAMPLPASAATQIPAAA